jgi:hypothetical protein
VLFGKWSGTEVKIDDQELLIMKESDVMGVIEGAGATKKKGSLTSSPPHFNIGTENHVRKMLDSPPMPAKECCAASTFSTTR